MAKFFGTNGIRGVFPGELTLEFVHDMALAIGTHFGRAAAARPAGAAAAGKGTSVLLGFDGRESSPVIRKVVSSALNSIGIDCRTAGMVPTPCLEFAVKALGYSGGMMITASHNPPQYNGIKPVAADGVEISREDELVIEDIYARRDWPGGGAGSNGGSSGSRRNAGPAPWGATGPETRAVDTYLDGILSHVDSGLIRSRRFRVVLDLGNGAQAVSAPDLCRRRLGCETLLLNGELDGGFPGRGPEPTPQNLSALSRAVVDNGADLGVAFDGDGDRSLFCDDRGEILTGDRSALLLVRHVLGASPGSTVVTCLNSGSAIEAVAGRSGSPVVRTRVGSVEVSRRMVADGALLGFEENGGFMYGRHNHVRDGCMTLALMLDLLAAPDPAGGQAARTLSGEAASLPPSFTAKDKVPCPPGGARRLVATLRKRFPGSDTTDGIKIRIGPDSWVMVRPSGTEPLVRVYAEAGSQDGLDRIMSEYAGMVRSIVGPA